MPRNRRRLHKARAFIKGFDKHCTCGQARSTASGHGSGAGKWVAGFFASRRFYSDPESPHFRYTQRTLALPSKHWRAEAKPLKETHSKTI